MNRISRRQFNDAMKAYIALVSELPECLSSKLPTFDGFLNLHNPAHLTWFHAFDEILMDDISLKKLQMCLSPHAKTLLAAWATQQLS
jgi:hypothetical protein